MLIENTRLAQFLPQKSMKTPGKGLFLKAWTLKNKNSEGEDTINNIQNELPKAESSTDTQESWDVTDTPRNSQNTQEWWQEVPREVGKEGGQEDSKSSPRHVPASPKEGWKAHFL